MLANFFNGMSQVFQITGQNDLHSIQQRNLSLNRLQNQYRTILFNTFFSLLFDGLDFRHKQFTCKSTEKPAKKMFLNVYLTFPEWRKKFNIRKTH